MVKTRQRRKTDAFSFFLLTAVFVIATCGLVYELVAGALASYLLGDSVLQFSTVIGVYLCAMGVGSYLSKGLEGDLIRWFVRLELLVGLVGGLSGPLLYAAFHYIGAFPVLLYSLVALTGMLVGIEIPLLMRILSDRFTIKDLVSRVFAVDYLGALLASLLFPLLLVPYLGLIRTSLFFGLINTIVAWWILFRVEETRHFRRAAIRLAMPISLLLLSGMFFSEKLTSWVEGSLYQDPIILSRSSPYQRVVITGNKREFKLFLNGNLQFASSDEYRYHEALVHPGMAGLAQARNILVLGGGDGLAVREILKWPSVKNIHLVDLDPVMIDLFRDHSFFSHLNQGALKHPKVTVTHADAFQWVRQAQEQYDFIVIDFPDPSNYSIGKLYTETFYLEVKKRLKPNGALVVQSTSPYVARRSFWCINTTLDAAGFHTIPYHCYVPSFGEWGYILASPAYNLKFDFKLPIKTRFLSANVFRQMLVFPPDMAPVKVDVNRLNNQALVHYFEADWGPYSNP